MIARTLAITVSALLVPSALGQLRASSLEQQGRLHRLNGGGVKAQFPQPNRNLGGVPAQFPTSKLNLGGTRVNLPFTRLGPTARTIGQERGDPQFQQPLQPSRGRPTRNTPSHPGSGSSDGTGGRMHRPDAPTIIVLPPNYGFAVDGNLFGHGPYVLTDGTYLNVGRGFHSDSSSSISGAFDDGNFKLRFRVGGGNLFPIVGPTYIPPRWYAGRGCWGGSCYVGSDPIYGTMAGYNPGMSDATAPEPPAQLVEPAPPATDLERGDLLMQAGETKHAISAYQSHLRSHPGDSQAMRSLGLAMIAASQFKDGIAMVSLAYKSDPLLASQPIEAFFFGNRSQLRRMVERVSGFSNRSRLPGAWLTLAALMQAEGRYELALKMIDRGLEAGLEPEVAAQMTAALKY